METRERGRTALKKRRRKKRFQNVFGLESARDVSYVKEFARNRLVPNYFLTR